MDEQDLQPLLAQLAAMQAKIRGGYPEGNLISKDEGGLAMAITTLKGKVVLAFGEQTSWIAFNRKQALELARDIANRAAELPAGPSSPS